MEPHQNLASNPLLLCPSTPLQYVSPFLYNEHRTSRNFHPTSFSCCIEWKLWRRIGWRGEGLFWHQNWRGEGGRKSRRVVCEGELVGRRSSRIKRANFADLPSPPLDNKTPSSSFLFPSAPETLRGPPPSTLIPNAKAILLSSLPVEGEVEQSEGKEKNERVDLAEKEGQFWLADLHSASASPTKCQKRKEKERRQKKEGGEKEKQASGGEGSGAKLRTSPLFFRGEEEGIFGWAAGTTNTKVRRRRKGSLDKFSPAGVEKEAPPPSIPLRPPPRMAWWWVGRRRKGGEAQFQNFSHIH